MMLLGLSILSLLAGPLLYQKLRAGGLILRTMDNAIAMVLAGLVVLVLLPDTWHAIGWAGLALVLTGYLIPGLLERVIRTAADTLHRWTVLVALAGLAAHSMLDGAGLASSESGLHALPWAIVLHRFAVGMALWMMLQPAFGRRWSWLALAGVAAATVLGWLLSASLPELHDGRVTAIVQALVTGAVIHGLIHRSHGDHSH